MTTTACPRWLDEYAVRHALARRQPSSARYLVYTCLVDMPFPCLGIGDRFRHVASLLRIAAAFDLCLLIDWTSPHPIEHQLSPNRIDWRPSELLSPAATADMRREPIRRWLHPFTAQSLDAALSPLGSPQQRFVRVMGNLRSNMGNRRLANVTADYACLWRFLFDASPPLASRITSQQ
eukprot:1100383-Prymnesium_polylepis.1